MTSSQEQEKVGLSKTIVLTATGGYDKLKIEHRPIPEIKENEVLINVKANGINFAELMCRQGLYNGAPPMPAVLGMEGSGIVTKIGSAVSDLKEGDHVCFLSKFNTWSEHSAVPANQCFKMPEKMTFEEGAALPVNYITAYQMLFDLGNLRPGKSVLIHMAAGGVGCAATQLCQTVPNVTIFGTASEPKHETIHKMGVTHPIDYRNKDYVEEVRKISPNGVDIILDPLGGDDGLKNLSLLKRLGKTICFGAANMVTGEKASYLQIAKTWWNMKKISPLDLMMTNKSVCGYHLGKLEVEDARQAGFDLMKLYEAGKIKPVIDSVWAYEDIAKAMDQMHSRKNIGKVIICPQKSPTGDTKEAEEAKE